MRKMWGTCIWKEDLAIGILKTFPKQVATYQATDRGVLSPLFTDVTLTGIPT